MAINRVTTWLDTAAKELAEQLTEHVTRAQLEWPNHDGPDYVCASVQLRIAPAWCASVVECAPVAQPMWYWRPATADAAIWLGAGATLQVMAAGADRFTVIRRTWEQARSRVRFDAEQRTRFLFGFSFADHVLEQPWLQWPNAILTLPRWLFRVSPDGQADATVVVEVNAQTQASTLVAEVTKELLAMLDIPVSRSPASQAAATAWDKRDAVKANEDGALLFQSLVSATAAEIRAGRAEKVVMARQVKLPSEAVDGIGVALERLRKQYPASTTFAVRQAGECLLGASPERLAITQSGRVVVDCLAGTTGRDADVAVDQALAEALLGSAKDVHEHQVVVDAIEKRLSTFATDITLEVNREIIRLPNVQHLYSRVGGRLQAGQTLFDVAQTLHPTPAIAGHPRAVATRTIRLREPFDRGWYAGGVGVIDAQGDGEIAVTLRSALVTNAYTYLFAGCGIMGTSNPVAEWNETVLKLQPMRMAFGLEDEAAR